MLRIDHPVPDYDGWKQAFDSDLPGREKSSVRRYQISKPIGNAKYVLFDLEFDTQSQAEALLSAMRQVWKNVEGRIMRNPQARIVRVLESKEY